jgi:GMP synthase-like glutamine amidotransferase
MKQAEKLTLGILNTGYLDPHLEGAFGNYSQMFKALFAQQTANINLVTYDAIKQQYPTDINDCDAYLITGSKHDAYGTEPWILALRDFITTLSNQQKKLVGICFGHQLIAHTLGGLTQKSDKGWGVGRHSYDLTTSSPSWLNRKKTDFSLIVSHQDQVTALPDGATLLASSDFCPHAAYYIDDHILCFQGHPEFKPALSLALTQSRQHIIEPHTYAQGLKSAPKVNDAALIAQWILNFIK